MIEISINYETFGFTPEQLAVLNSLLAETKLRTKGVFVEHERSIKAVTTTRWTNDD